MKTTNLRKGTMFIIEGPSGAGKGSVVKKLLKEDKNLNFSISVTTRPKRPTEIEGKDYYFISDDEYDNLLKQDAFYEANIPYGKRYGTLKSKVDCFLDVGQDVLLDIDWAGARQIKEKAPEATVTIYLLPPSINELYTRLVNRQSDSPETIAKRMKELPEKISHWREFDYLVVNDNLDEAVKQIQDIIKVERMRRHRQIEMLKFAEELEKESLKWQ